MSKNDLPFSSIDCYSKYLENVGINLDLVMLSLVAKTIESTDWDNPTSALDWNNIAVVALVESEQCQDSFLRGMYFEMALEALNKGVKLQGHPLCAAHLALCFTMTGEIEQALDTTFLTLLNTLHNSSVNEQPISPGLVYLPPANSFTNSRHDQLTQILQSDNGYTQVLLFLSEVFCRAPLTFYSLTGQRYLHLAAQLFTDSSFINLKLGISSIGNQQDEGVFYLHRAIKIAPKSENILQSLYLAYRDLGQMEMAKFWLNKGRECKKKQANYLDHEWTELEIDSPISYVSFEKQLILVIEPSLRSAVTRVLIAEGDWFEKEMEFWRNWIKPGMIVIDVGANVGVYAFSAALRVGEEGCVLAVEPFSGCIRCLQETCKINQLSWVKVCAGAASNRNGTAQLALHTASEVNTLVEPSTEGASPYGILEEVTCFTLDSLILQENVSNVDLLKIDSEGHELQVLEGSSQLITEFYPVILYENNLGNRGSSLAVVDFLTAREYKLFYYQPYLQELIPINSPEDLQGRLNIIALHN
ncbi:MAG: FkbM family methyltransferase [Potamolinea sp.]